MQIGGGDPEVSTVRLNVVKSQVFCLKKGGTREVGGYIPETGKAGGARALGSLSALVRGAPGTTIVPARARRPSPLQSLSGSPSCSGISILPNSSV